MNFRIVIFISFLFILMTILYGCFWQKQGRISDAVYQTDNSGSLSINLTFNPTEKKSEKAPAEVKSVKITLPESGFIPVVFPASQGAGLIENIPVGSYSIGVSGLDSGGEILYYGEANINVLAGECTNVDVFMIKLGTIKINNDALSTNLIQVNLQLNFGEAVDMRFSNDGNFSGVSWITYSVSYGPWNLAAGADGVRSVYCQFRTPGGVIFDGIDTINYVAGPTNVIFVDKNAPGIIENGTSWEFAYRSLNPGIISATAVPGTDVWVATGTYTPEADSGGDLSPGDDRMKTFLSIPSVQIVGGFSGYNGSRESNISQRDGKQFPVFLSGDIGVAGIYSDNCYHVISGNGGTLDTLNIVDGYGTLGGGVYCTTAGITLQDCIIADNDAVDAGGGIYCSGQTLTLTGTTVENNTAENYPAFDYSGGGVCVINGTLNMSGAKIVNNESDGNGAGIALENTSGTFINCTIKGNNSISGSGGGATFVNASNPTLSNVEFISNTAWSGGGLYNDTSSPTITGGKFQLNSGQNGGGIDNWESSMVATNVDFLTNSASGGSGNGGAVYSRGGGHPVFDGGTYSNNTASGQGGALFHNTLTTTKNISFLNNSASSAGAIFCTTNARIYNCIFRGNQATAYDAGALFVQRTQDIINCRFENNSATGNGGAIAIPPSGTLYTIGVYNCVFHDNSAVNGGGIHILGNNSKSLKLVNSTFYNNTATGSGNGGGVFLDYLEGNSTSIDNCIFRSNIAGGTGNQIYCYHTASFDITINRTCLPVMVVDGTEISVSGPVTLTDSNSFTDDPLFSNPSTYGGLSLQTSSPCRDRADSNVMTQDAYDVDGDLDLVELLPLDGYRQSRYVDTPPNLGIGPEPTLDIGAVELQ